MSIIEKALQARKPERQPDALAGRGKPGGITKGGAGQKGQRPGTSPSNRPRVSLRALTDQSLLRDPRTEGLLDSQLRHLKRSVLKAVFGELAGERSNIVALTSAMPGAGKTFMTANLGQTLALERDLRVLLVDADNTRATLSRTLGLRDRSGFFDLLNDSSLQIDGHTLETEIDKLALLPSGGHHNDSLELLGSHYAKEMIEKLAAQDPDRLVLVDCPPLLGTPDAAALTGLVGQVLLVVEAGVTTEDEVNKALQLVEPGKPVGLVLNKIPKSRLLSATGAYYYYTYSADSKPAGVVAHG